MGIFCGYSDLALAHSSAGICNPSSSVNKALPRSVFFVRPQFMVGRLEALRSADSRTGIANSLRSATNPRFATAGGGSLALSEDSSMSNITPLHPANAERAQSLIASIPDPSSPVDMDRLTGELPEMLGYVVALILDDFDYDANLRSKTAIAIRILATIAERFEGVQA